MGHIKGGKFSNLHPLYIFFKIIIEFDVGDAISITLGKTSGTEIGR